MFTGFGGKYKKIPENYLLAAYYPGIGWLRKQKTKAHGLKKFSSAGGHVPTSARLLVKQIKSFSNKNRPKLGNLGPIGAIIGPG